MKPKTIIEYGVVAIILVSVLSISIVMAPTDNPGEASLKARVEVLEALVDELLLQLETHTHPDYALVDHTHEYSELTGKPTILTDLEVIALLEEYALLRQPDFDSGWFSMDPYSGSLTWTTLTHNLGTKNVLVHILGRDQALGEILNPLYVHQWGDPSDYDFAVGVDWRLDENTMDLFRRTNDWAYDEIRVKIWILSETPI